MANYKLNQTGEQIQADLNLLDSNSATEGQVLTANGTGGASWQNASGGGKQLYVHNIKVKGTYKISNKSIEFSAATALIRIISSKPDSYTINDYVALANIIGNTSSPYDSAPIGERCGIIISGQGNHFYKAYALFGTSRVSLSVSAFDTSFDFLSVDTVTLKELTDAVVPL